MPIAEGLNSSDIKTSKIKSISLLGRRKVVNLNVKGNHTFITKNGIPTHNCDYLSVNAQAILRGIIEENSNNCRFVLTCNYPHKIIPAIADSRCTRVHTEKLDMDSFILRLVDILSRENVSLVTEDDVDVLNTFVQAAYPDMRKCIGLLQNNIIEGKLVRPDSSDTSTMEDYKIRAIDLIKSGKIKEAREVIVAQIKLEEYEEFYRLFYRNLDWWGTTVEQQDEAILIIRDGLVKHTSVSDPEINLSATLVGLSRVRG